MTLEKIRAALGWCAVINGGILLAWIIAFTVAHDWIHDIHGNWFQLSKERFDAVKGVEAGVDEGLCVILTQ